MPSYGLIGYPLTQSSSKPFFEKKFELEHKKDARFLLFRIKDVAEFPSILNDNPDLKGLAVTIPHKQAIMQYLDHVDATAAAIGAVNCIRISSGKLYGFNTDAPGFQSSLISFLDNNKPSALVLGTGGAAKAVEYALKKMDIRYQMVSRRALQDHFTYDQITKDVMTMHHLVINCTPVGMTGYSQDAPDIPYKYLTPKHFLYDLIYKPPYTEFMKMGETMGAKVKNGEQMFLHQAEENWRIWNL